MLWWMFFVACLIILFGGALLLVALLALWKVVLGLLLGVLALRTFTVPRGGRGSLWR